MINWACSQFSSFFSFIILLIIAFHFNTKMLQASCYKSFTKPLFPVSLSHLQLYTSLFTTIVVTKRWYFCQQHLKKSMSLSAWLELMKWLMWRMLPVLLFIMGHLLVRWSNLWAGEHTVLWLSEKLLTAPGKIISALCSCAQAHTAQ